MLNLHDQVKHSGFGFGEVVGVFKDPDAECDMAVIRFDAPPGMLRTAGPHVIPMVILPADMPIKIE